MTANRSKAMLRTYAKNHLPADDDPRWEQWQKRPAIVRMMPLRGPCQIVTVDAPTELPEGWEGWLAIDAAGHPYPLHKDVQAAMYVMPDTQTIETVNSAVGGNPTAHLKGN